MARSGAGISTAPEATGRVPASGMAGATARSAASISAWMAAWLSGSRASEIKVIRTPSAAAASTNGPTRSEPSP